MSELSHILTASARRLALAFLVSRRHCTMVAIWGTVADPGSPLHGRAVEMSRNLPDLNAVLLNTIQTDVPSLFLPASRSDFMQIIFPRLSSAPDIGGFNAAQLLAGTIEGMAPPVFGFSHSLSLADAAPEIRAFLAADNDPLPPVNTHYLYVRLGGETQESIIEVRSLADLEPILDATRLAGQVPMGCGYAIRITMDNNSSISLGLPVNSPFRSHHSNAQRFLNMSELISRVESIDPAQPPTTPSGSPAVYALVETEFANGRNQGLIDSAVFLVPRVHEEGVRVARAYITQGIQSDSALNGRVAMLVPDLTGLPQPLNTCQALATEDAVMPPLTRWPMEVAPASPNGNPSRMRLRPLNLLLQPVNLDSE